MQLNGVAAIVTGGASGLGEATARRLAELGARVAIFDMNAERGHLVAGGIGGLYCLADVTDEASVDAALAAARDAHGQERILVNCAGIAIGQKTATRDRNTGAVTPHPLASFTRVIAVNLIGTFHMIAKCAAGMLSLEPVTVNDTEVVPRDVFIACAEPALRKPEGRDLVALRVEAEGRKDGKPRRVTFDLVDYLDEKSGITAMERTTGFSLSITGQFQATGKVKGHGVLTPDLAMPADDYIRALGERGIDIRRREA